MNSLATRLVVSPEAIKTFPSQFSHFVGQIEQAPGFDHYRLIPRDNAGRAYTLLTFWQSQKHAHLGKQINFPATITKK